MIVLKNSPNDSNCPGQNCYAVESPSFQVQTGEVTFARTKRTRRQDDDALAHGHWPLATDQRASQRFAGASAPANTR